MSIKFLLGSVVTAAIIFTGCSSKDASTSTTQGVGANSGAGLSSGANGSNGTAGAGASGGMSTPALSADAAMESAQGKLGTVLFDFDKFNIRADMQPVAEANAKVATEKAVDGTKIKLEGNADERGSDEYNYALALKRAEALKAAYQAKGVAASRITTVSLGEGNPVCKESNEECWAKNRRVDTKLAK